MFKAHVTDLILQCEQTGLQESGAPVTLRVIAVAIRCHM